MNIFVFALSTGYYMLFALLIIFLIVIGSKIKIIPEGKECVVERIGVYYRTIRSGYNYIMPFIDIIIFTYDLMGNKTQLINALKQSIEISPKGIVTNEGQKLTLKLDVALQIFDSKQYVYTIDKSIYSSITSMIATPLREKIIELSKSDFLRTSNTIFSSVIEEVKEKMLSYGILLIDISLSDFE